VAAFALLVSIAVDASVARSRYLANGFARCFWRQSRLEDADLLGVDAEHIVEREEVRSHYSLRRLKRPAYLLLTLSTALRNFRSRAMLRFGLITRTCPFVETSTSAFSPSLNSSSNGVSSTNATPFPVRVSFLIIVRTRYCKVRTDSKPRPV